MTPTARFQMALRAVFQLTADEAEGRGPALPVIRGRILALERAETACPDAPAVYTAAAAAWRASTGRCHACGQVLTEAVGCQWAPPHAASA
jgi:hypothetical protein